MGEWSVHSHEEGEVGAATMGLAHPTPWAASSLLYIGGWSSSLSLAHSHAPLGLSSRCSTVTSHGLGEALLELFLHHHHAVVLEFPVDPSTSAAQLERGNGGLRQAVRVTEHGCAASLRALVFAILRSASDRLHHPRDYISLALLFIEGEFF